MSQFKYSVNCEDQKDTDLLFNHIKSFSWLTHILEKEGHMIYCIADDEIIDIIEHCVIDNHLKTVSVESWPEEIDYDDAEELSELDLIVFDKNK